MTSLCPVSRSGASVSTKNRYDFHCRRYLVASPCGVHNSPQWSEAIVHTYKRAFKWQRTTLCTRVEPHCSQRCHTNLGASLKAFIHKAFSATPGVECDEASTKIFSPRGSTSPGRGVDDAIGRGSRAAREGPRPGTTAPTP